MNQDSAMLQPAAPGASLGAPGRALGQGCEAPLMGPGPWDPEGQPRLVQQPNRGCGKDLPGDRLGNHS